MTSVPLTCHVSSKLTIILRPKKYGVGAVLCHSYFGYAVLALILTSRMTEGVSVFTHFYNSVVLPLFWTGHIHLGTWCGVAFVFLKASGGGLSGWSLNRGDGGNLRERYFHL